MGRAFCFSLGMPSVPNLDALSCAELKALVIELLGKVAALERTVAAQRDEIARLKGLKERPTIQPSGLDQQTRPQPPRSEITARRTGPKASRLTIHEERIIAADVPAGSRFKGYEDFLVQDLVLRPHVVRIRRERWITLDGQTVTAAMPPTGLAISD